MFFVLLFIEPPLSHCYVKHLVLTPVPLRFPFLKECTLTLQDMPPHPYSQGKSKGAEIWKLGHRKVGQKWALK